MGNFDHFFVRMLWYKGTFSQRRIFIYCIYLTTIQVMNIQKVNEIPKWYLFKAHLQLWWWFSLCLCVCSFESSVSKIFNDPMDENIQTLQSKEQPFQSFEAHAWLYMTGWVLFIHSDNNRAEKMQTCRALCFIYNNYTVTV